MDTRVSKNKEKIQTKQTAPVFELKKIKSILILRKIFEKFQRNKTLQIIKYNKYLQGKLNFSLEDYQNYPVIKIEIKPSNSYRTFSYGYGNQFINIPYGQNTFFHIYINDEKKERNLTELTRCGNIRKIKIIIDYEVKSLANLFSNINNIDSIEFTNFYRNDINNMSNMFSGCYSLKEIKFSKFITDNVTDMSYMFNGCSSLKELNLSNFNTNNVTNMNYMFNNCSSLTELNLSNFNTNNVTNILYMFYNCKSLKK